MTSGEPARDLTRTVFAVLFLGGLLTAAFWVLRPFLAPLVWAALIVISTWPALLRLQGWFGGRRALAVAAMVVVILLAFLVPLGFLLSAIVRNAPAIVAWIKALPDAAPDHLPDWVREVPLAGPQIASTWDEWMSEGPQGLGARAAPYLDDLLSWATGQLGNAGLLFVQVLLTLVLALVLYLHGERYAASVLGFARRLGGDRGDRATQLAASAIRGVALGVVVTALVQAVVGGIGLFVAGVPAAGLLTAIMFLSGIAQLGAAPVVGLSALWLWSQGHGGAALLLAGWMLVVGSLDNVLRPILIRKGVDLPMLLVFSGVIGGLMAFGPIGLFVGPVVLALGYTLLAAWIAEPQAP